MRAHLSAQRGVLAAWRIYLALAALPVSFFSSVFLRVGSLFWWAATCAWVICFLFFYLYYLPAKQRGFTLGLGEDELVLSFGVFSSVRQAIPLKNIQHIRVCSSPVHRRLRLCTLVIVCAGGRARMPGLTDQQAQDLAAAIFR